MPTPKFVFAAIDTPVHQLEQLLERYDLIIGPLLPGNQEAFYDFLALTLPLLVQKASTQNRQIFLHLKPMESGWMIEQINQGCQRGLNQQNLNGLVLDHSNYRGSLRQLSVEASSFEGRKILIHKRRPHDYCEGLQNGVWSGLFLFAEGKEEIDRYNESVAVLKKACRLLGVREAIWTERFSDQSLCVDTTILGADGFYTDISKVLPET